MIGGPILFPHPTFPGPTLFLGPILFFPTLVPGRARARAPSHVLASEALCGLPSVPQPPHMGWGRGSGPARE